MLALVLAAGTWAQAQDPAGSKRPFEITDNSFFIEEAFNQEPGIVQNIFTTLWVRDTGGSDQDALSFSFTQEWPLGTQKHQFSYVIPVEYLSSAPSQGFLKSQRGLGDILINYRYQALDEGEDGTPAFSPRFSFLLPSGDEDAGFGNGAVGYQFNLPLSKQYRDFYFHANAGMTFFPGAEAGSLQEDLWGYNLGGSVIWRASGDVNFLVEVLADVMDEFEENGKEKVPIVLFSPGVRWGKWLGKTQLVIGSAFPIGVTEESDDFGVFFYLSLEFPFR